MVTGIPLPIDVFIILYLTKTNNLPQIPTDENMFHRTNFHSKYFESRYPEEEKALEVFQKACNLNQEKQGLMKTLKGLD